jgi:hypothetical protein
LAKLLKNTLQRQPKFERGLRGEANDHYAPDQGGAAAALERRSNIPNQFHSIIEIAPEIDQCCNCPVTRKQRLLVKVRICFINAAEGISPDQSPIFLYAPAICDLPVNHLLAMR